MSSFQRLSMFFLRISLGWMLLYAGVMKLMDPTWSAAGYLNAAKTFSGFYAWLATPGMLGLTNFVNEWALTVLGILIVVGLAVRFAGIASAAMMALYYFPVLDFPYPNAHALIVDEHIVYVFGFLVLAAFGAGLNWGIDGLMLAHPNMKKMPKLRAFLS
jgi:thiosulfate dehydrogenase [quinone] large subunit